MNVVREVESALAQEGLLLRKASPRGPDRLLLETHGPAGVGAAQWYADPDRAAEAHRLLARRFGADATARLTRNVVLQRGGADRKLPGLRALVGRPGSSLVAHRAERRAVVRDGSGGYTKVVRPERLEAVTAPLRSVRLPGVRTPTVVRVDDRAGAVSVAALPGVTLHDRICDPDVTDADAADDARRTGAALRVLHERTPVHRLPTEHGTDDELAAIRRWLDAATGHRLLDRDRCDQAVAGVARSLATAVPSAVVHRDFHDKQVLVTADGVGILDLDLACWGEPALDVANLLAHLELRQLQGRCSAARSGACREAFLQGYGPDGPRADRVAAHAAATRLRLAGVYTFRPAPPGLVEQLLASVPG